MIQRIPRKHNLLKRNMKTLDKAELVADVLNIDWKEVLSIESCELIF